jgi:hypothetical protein
MTTVQQLGKNNGAYRGETIDISSVLNGCARAALRHGWTSRNLPVEGGLELAVFTRAARAPGRDGAVRRVYVSTGIHGDEPAGPLAALRLLEQDGWPDCLELLLLPCLNPTGFPLNRRENAQGKDLNRDYRHLETAEIRAHVAWLNEQPAFDLTFCLHEDWESHGFYLYELNPESRKSLAQRMVAAVGRVCPIDPSPEIEGNAASGGIISPRLDPNTRPQWPEAFWLLQNKTRQSYTLEAPSDFPLAARVDALVTAIDAALAAQ